MPQLIIILSLIKKTDDSDEYMPPANESDSDINLIDRNDKTNARGSMSEECDLETACENTNACEAMAESMKVQLWLKATKEKTPQTFFCGQPIRPTFIQDPI